MKTVFAGLLLLLSLLAPPVMAKAMLKVGLSPDYPPLQFLHDGRIVGVEPDNARTVGELLGRRVKLVPMAFDALIPALRAGEIDVIMSGLSVTAERSRQVLFTDAYLRVGQMPIMLKDNIGRFSQPWSIYGEGVRVGVEPGTTGAAWAERELGDAELVYLKDPQEAFAALRADWVDLYLHDAPTSWQLANSLDNDDLISLYTPLTEEMLAWAVAPGNSALQADLNRALNSMRANGTLNYILNRWIPVQVEVR